MFLYVIYYTVCTILYTSCRWECGVREEGEERHLENSSLCLGPNSNLLHDNLYDWDNDEILGSNLLGDFKEVLEGM